ncbi:hypothetical protein [Streptomyces sp. ME19-01-6]|uniref:hypothetical protein n=1 Tax=Streptomyces sp. ME19-01-6 TaxID=3028686 RepID=UPI0029A2682D|nr:hypothetical protein [Streptomyces sp. ME19-01-6]MDX3233685.1 hypothetical protein [Streptomyces sp. ME19-01-6]
MRRQLIIASVLSAGVALLTACGSSSDSQSNPSAPSASEVISQPASGDDGTSRNPSSSELDFTWFPDGGANLAPLGIRHGEALMPTVNECDGKVTFGQEVTISFPCGTERARGTLRVNQSADKLSISWTSGVTDTFVKRSDLTVPDPTITGTPDMEDLQRQLDELKDLVDDGSGLTG